LPEAFCVFKVNVSFADLCESLHPRQEHNKLAWRLEREKNTAKRAPFVFAGYLRHRSYLRIDVSDVPEDPKVTKNRRQIGGCFDPN